MASCSGGDSFRITGFPLAAFDGCYSASAVSTFNFLPIFYNTADSMPADGPTVYASDLFGTLSDEYVFAIGRYDQERDVVDRRCFDAATTSAATTHPSEVVAWDCGNSSSTFAVTCGCSTPAPLDAATPPVPSPAPSFGGSTPSPSDSATPEPSTAATVRVSATPAPTGSASAATPSPSDASRGAGTPSPAPTTASNSSNTPSSPEGGACSGADSFRLDGFQIDSYNGCYSASAESTFNFLPMFFIGGAPVDGATVYASDLFGALTDEYVWSIGNYIQSGDFVDARHCTDADATDASTIHPSEVAAWECEDLDATAFSIACGCATPAPVAAASPAPTTPSPGDGSREVDLASSAPVAAADLPEDTPAGDAEGVPLVVAIITGLAIFVVVMIVLSIAFEGMRKGIWMCLTCKRESTSEDTALSASWSASKRSSRGELEPPVPASGSTTTL
eukprot:g1623.t1